MIKIGIYVKSDKNRYKDSETKIKKYCIYRMIFKCEHVYLLLIPALMCRDIEMSRLAQINNKTQIYVGK